MKYMGFLSLPLCAGLLGGWWQWPFLAVALCLPQAGLLGWYFRRTGAVASALLTFSAWIAPRMLHLNPAAPSDFSLPVIGSLLAFLYAWTNAQSRAHVEHAHYHAKTDSLTNLLNRNGFEQHLQSEVHRSSRRFSPMTVVFMDCDRFKQLNDTRGHHVGDALLKSVAGVMESSIRDFDSCARLGGDEFSLLFPNTDLADARRILDRLQYRLDALAGVHQWDVSWSIGAVTFLSPASPQKMLQLADKLMYEVKHTGKGRIALREWHDRLAPSSDSKSDAARRG